MKSCTTASCFIVAGMFRMVWSISRNQLPRPRVSARLRSNSAMSSGGYSFDVKIVQSTAKSRAKAPTWNEYLTVRGTPLTVESSTPSLRNISGSALAMAAPAPMKNDCMTKPVVRCSGTSLSATKARNGSIEMLTLASRSHRKSTAISTNDEYGMKKSASAVRMAPTRKYGRRRPKRFHVRSLIEPMMGWTMSPVSGAASQRMGMSSVLAPRFLKMLLMFAC